MIKWIKLLLIVAGRYLGAETANGDTWLVIGRKYRRLVIENPFYLAFFSLLVFWLPDNWINAVLSGAFLSSVISVSAIIAGFLTMGISVLLALGGKTIMRLLDKWKLKKVIYQSVWRAAKWMFVTVAVAMLALLVTVIKKKPAGNDISVDIYCKMMACIVVFMIIGATCSGLGAFRNISAVINRHVEFDEDGNI